MEQSCSVWHLPLYILQGQFKRGSLEFQWILLLQLLNLKKKKKTPFISQMKDKILGIDQNLTSRKGYFNVPQTVLWFSQRQISSACNSVNGNTSEIILLEFVAKLRCGCNPGACQTYLRVLFQFQSLLGKLTLDIQFELTCSDTIFASFWVSPSKIFSLLLNDATLGRIWQINQDYGPGYMSPLYF